MLLGINWQRNKERSVGGGGHKERKRKRERPGFSEPLPVVKFPFPLVHGRDTPAGTWSDTEMYNSYKHHYITVLQNTVVVFSSEERVLLGERAGAKLWSPGRGGGELGISSAKSVVTSTARGQAGRVGRDGLLRILLFPQSSSFLIPSAFRERDFTETHVLSSFFLSPLSVLKIKFPKEGTEKSTAPKSCCFSLPKDKKKGEKADSSRARPPLSAGRRLPLHHTGTWSLALTDNGGSWKPRSAGFWTSFAKFTKGTRHSPAPAPGLVSLG